MRRRRWTPPLLAVLLLVGMASGCSDELITSARPGLGYPTVPGLWILDENGELRGSWGSPANGGLGAYPNPSNLFAIDFLVTESARVEIWVARALGPGEAPPRTDTGFAGAQIHVLPDSHTRTLLSEVLDANQYRIMWDGHDDAGNRAATGFYRIFAAIGQEQQFADVWYVNGEDLRLPPGLEWMLQ